MPELPEVETIRCGLAPRLEGRRLIRVEPRRAGLRIPFPADLAARLIGRRVSAVTRRAKYLLMHLDDRTVVILHLGMSGRIVLTPEPGVAPGKHDHLILTTDDGLRLTFHDARRFGLVTLTDAEGLPEHPLLARLGPEPLGEAFTPEGLSDQLAGRFAPIKAALLDQTVVAGLGNIYVAEALFHAGISPVRPADSVAGADARRLVPAIRRVLEEAIAAGGSTLRDYVQASGESGYFQHHFAVYGRTGQACPGCTCAPSESGGIVRITQSNRSTFYCPVRQR